MSCRLIIREEGEESVIDLKDESIQVGRTEECHIALADAKCSRKQCEIVPAEGSWKVIDLESRNGTRVNDQTVNQQVLQHGDVIRIGQVTITFEDPLRDPARKIPGRLSDYQKEPSKGGPAQIQPGKVDLKPRTKKRFKGRPSLEKTTQHLNKSELQPLSTDAIPRSRAKIDSARREREERQVIRTVSWIAGIVLGVFVLGAVVSTIARRSPGRGGPQGMYREAYEKFTRAQNDPDPASSLATARDARRNLRLIGPEGGAVYGQAELLMEDVEALIKAKELLVHAAEQQAVADLEARAAKGLSSRELEALLEDIGKVRDRFTQALPETHKRLDALAQDLESKRGSTLKHDLAEGSARIQAFLDEKNFVRALTEADKLEASLREDVGLHGKAVEEREKVVESVRLYVNEMRLRAEELRAQNDPAGAKRLYADMIRNLGEGRVDAFRGYVDLLVRERDR